MNLVKTKKMLVGYSPDKKSTSKKDFVFPYKENNKIKFVGIETKKEFEYAFVVYVGVEISAEILYNKLSEYNHQNIDKDFLNKYLQLITTFKISEIIEIDNDLLLKKSPLILNEHKSKLP